MEPVYHAARIDRSSFRNFRFSSGNFRDYSRSIEDILQQNIFSAASFVKRWDESNRSLSVSVTRDQSLTNGDIREVLRIQVFHQSFEILILGHQVVQNLFLDAEEFIVHFLDEFLVH